MILIFNCLHQQVDRLLVRLIIFCFMFAFRFFFIALCIRLGLFYVLVIGVAFVTILWILLGSTFFIACMVERGWPCMILCEMFSQLFHMSVARANLCPSTPCLIVFALSSRNCAFSWWCLHVGKCYHHWPHSNWFGFTSCFFLWSCCDNGNLGKMAFSVISS